MKIIADENVDYAIVRVLKENNFEVIHIGEILSGIDDQQVILYANREKAILLTEDKDFGELVYRLNMANFGVILIRLSGIESLEKAKIVYDAITNNFEKMKNSFSVINLNKIRIKSLRNE